MIDSDHKQAKLLQELEQLRQRVSDLELALTNQPEQLGHESEAKQNTQLRELLISLALDFISFPNTEIDSRINKLLKQIGEFIGADRSYISSFSNNLETLTRVYEWCAQGIEPRIHLIQKLKIQPFSWTLEQYQRAETVHIRNIDDLPLESGERENALRSGAKSGIQLPLYYRGKLIGELGFNTLQAEKNWSEDTVNLMKIAAQIYINALEHRDSEAKLRESEQRYLSLLEQVPVAFMVWEKCGNQLQMAYANPAAGHFYQIEDIGSYIGMDALAFSATITYTEETQALAKKRSEAFLRGEKPGEAEYAIHQPDGSISYAILDSVHISYADKPAILTIIRDITEQRNAEKGLRESEKRLHSLLEALPDRVIVFDSEGTYHEILRSYDWYDAPGERGDTLHNLFPKAFADFCMEKIHETLQKQEKLIFEYEYDYLEKKRYILACTVPYQDPLTNQPQVIWISRDMSQQRHAERALRESEKRLRALLESLPDRAVVLDGEGTYHEVIRKDVWETDFPVDIGDNIRNVTTKAFADFCINKVRETLQLQQSLIFEYEYEDSRQKRFLEGRTVPYKDPVTEQPLVLWTLRNVTQERVTERNLRESEARYRTLVEQMPALVYRSSLTNPHETNYVSPFIQLLLGYSQEEWLASIHNWADHIHPDDRERIITEKRLSFPFVAEYRMLNRHNQLIWVRDESLIVRDANGQGLFIQGVVIDISQQKHFEKALRESEQSYRAVFNSSTVLLTIHDGETLLLANQATAEILGYEATDLIGLPLKGFIHPDDQSFVTKIAKLRRQGAQVPSRYHMRIVDRQGGVHWVDSHSQTIEFAGHQVTLASAVDITEQKRFEQILRESEANYRTIVQDQTDIICRFTPDFSLTFVNDAYEQYFGLSANDLVGSKLWDLLPVESRAENRLHLTTIMSKLSPDNPVGLEENDIVVKGEIRSVQFTNRALFDYKAKLVGYQSVGRDITERKKAEAELARYRDHLEELVKARTAQLQQEVHEHEQTQKSLRQSLEQLDAANKELEAFSYTVSHDLRAPLRALNNYSQFLQEDCAAILSEECLQYTEGIAESAQQMEKLVGDLLDYSRINRVEVPSADVDIAELIDEIVVRLQLDQQAKLNLPSKLPIIHAKRVRLEQIFINLLSNALKFRQKAIPLEITITFEEREDQWLFSVHDNGIGIDARYQTKIFGIFQRLHTQEEYEGTGIGLAIVEKAVKEHNGQVVVESEPGKGSKFSFTIARKLS